MSEGPGEENFKGKMCIRTYTRMRISEEEGEGEGVRPAQTYAALFREEMDALAWTELARVASETATAEASRGATELEEKRGMNEL